MVKKDLERIGIPYENEDGIADFHAAGRHTHITELLRNGATLPEAKELARHSDIKMTMKYTHIGIGDQAKAVGNLSVPIAPLAPSEPAAPVRAGKKGPLHGRCISGGVGGHNVTSDGNSNSAAKRQNPCRSKGFDAVRRQLSPADKVEAAGIEPASRGISTGASTCVADVLVFVPLGSYRRDSRGLIQELVEPRTYPAWNAASQIWRPTFGPLWLKPAVGSYLVRQLVRGIPRQVTLWSAFYVAC